MSDPEPTPTGWLEFDGKPVMLQLRSAYVLPGLQYEPVRTVDGQGVRALEMIRGILSVAPGYEASRLMLILRMPAQAPVEAVMIAIHPEDVLYCSHLPMQAAAET